MRYILVVLSLAALVARGIVRATCRRKMAAHLRAFTPIPDLDLYVESRPRINMGPPRLPHAVLLLHGYSGSPQDFEHLLPALERASIPYYAPLLTGFGLNDFRLLYEVKPADWFRDAIAAYEILAASADRVSIVGHSTGATLGVYVAAHRPVAHLVLTGPNLFPAPSDRRYKRILSTRGLSTLIAWLIPVLAKPVRPGRVSFTDTLDPEASKVSFNYPTVPMRSLEAQYALQDLVDLRRAHYASLSLLYGEQDLSVDIASLRRLLDRQGIRYTAIQFAGSAHNILEDYERREAVQAVVSLLHA